MADQPREWEIIMTPEVRDWIRGLSTDAANRVGRALRELSQKGPTLGRPFVDRMKTSRFHNMKELRMGPSHRILFAFDARERAVLLIGGDKAGKWDRWYTRNIPLADRRFEQHQRNSGDFTPWRPTTRTPGPRSAGPSR